MIQASVTAASIFCVSICTFVLAIELQQSMQQLQQSCNRATAASIFCVSICALVLAKQVHT
jgi:hypothetical protein